MHHTNAQHYKSINKLQLSARKKPGPAGKGKVDQGQAQSFGGSQAVAAAASGRPELGATLSDT